MADRRHRWKRRLILACGILILSAVILVAWFTLATRVSPPVVTDQSADSLKTDSLSPASYRLGRNWLKQSSSGLWEMYTEGKPYERGVINGKLSKHLIDAQEEAFISQIRQMIPSDFYLRFLKYMIYWFNRDLDHYVPEEYKEEIYGISKSASARYSSIGEAYQRMLNYHSAHDIGHALQDYRLVGCTSFGAWGDRTKDGSLILGRNFDFYAGDAFAKNKIVSFVRPEKGYPFMMITWGGMIGAVSGMNEKGLTVTINAAKSGIPAEARTPISILAREILQYASDIREAEAIAASRETFVSESILVGSARDGKAAIIEKTPEKMAVVIPTGNFIACANHFQSEAFARDPDNIANMRDNASLYRYRRLLQDLTEQRPIDYLTAAAILRDRGGLNGKDLGMGNEKAMNQLIAHHSVIFMPEKLLAWVSTSPWQQGPFVCYDLYKIFHKFAGLNVIGEITEVGKTIPRDSSLSPDEYRKFLEFRDKKGQLEHLLKSGNTVALPDSFFEAFRATNPMGYEVYSLTGDYYLSRQEWRKAGEEYTLALMREVPRWQEKERIIRKLAQCNVEIKRNKK